MPRISVIVPCHNGADTVVEALQSIVSQTFRDIEILVLDDGSTDDSFNIIEKISAEDSRVKIEASSKSGIVSSLNKLLDRASGEYIARMDADDIAHPHRLERQAALLKAKPRTGVVGSWVKTFGTKNEIWHCSPWDNKIKNQLLLGMTPLCHPTWMVRSDLYQAVKYEQEFESIEDREWLCRVFYSHPEVEFSAIPEILLNYRTHAKSVTAMNSALQIQKTEKIVQELFRNLGINIAQDLLKFHLHLAGISQHTLEPGYFISNLMKLREAFKSVIADDHQILALRGLECAQKLNFSDEKIAEISFRTGVSDLRKKPKSE